MSLSSLTLHQLRLRDLNEKLARIQQLSLSDLLTDDGGLRLPEAKRAPTTPPKDGVILYVKDGVLSLLDSDGIRRVVNTTP